MSPPLVRRLALGTLFFLLAVIVWGAFVRATGSGAGCGAHWPLCNGELVPRSPRTATLIELAHRVTSGLSLALGVALAAVVFRTHGKGHRLRWAAGAVVVLLVTEAAVGAGLVLFRLVAQDDSLARAVAMSAHLMNTFLLLGAAALTVDYASGTAAPRFSGQGLLGAMLLTTLVLMLVLGASGSVVALGDTLFPARSLAEGLRQDLSPTAHLLIRIRAIHPLLAILTASVAVATGVGAAASRPSAQVRQRGLTLALLFVAQLMAGLANLVLLAPVWLQLVHLLLADLCFITLVRLCAATLAADAPAPASVPLVAA